MRLPVRRKVNHPHPHRSVHNYNTDMRRLVLRRRLVLLLLLPLLLLLLRHGAGDCAQASLLTHFSRKGDPEAGVAALAGAGAATPPLDERDDRGFTLLMLACRWSSLPVGLRARVDAATLLLEKGAAHDVQDIEKGWTALHYAVYASKWAGTDMVDTLLAHPSLDADVAGKQGQTPLMIAAARGERKIVNSLLERGGVAVDAVNEEKHTAVMHAARDCARSATATDEELENCRDIVEDLINAGADLTLQDAVGNNVWHIAKFVGHTEIMKLVREHYKLAANPDGEEHEQEAPAHPSQGGGGGGGGGDMMANMEGMMGGGSMGGMFGGMGGGPGGMMGGGGGGGDQDAQSNHYFHQSQNPTLAARSPGLVAGDSGL
jgi:hypothetical protein